ncbi:MAG: nucleotidyl transferase AbiEii/AbiGii toxin family protein [Microbispora sp.]|nr:nucleotidyl transferase AbiEii/AbiGii toxin family protein [Microbispora sp.]
MTAIFITSPFRFSVTTIRTGLPLCRNLSRPDEQVAHPLPVANDRRPAGRWLRNAFALAGGYAVQVHGVLERPSEDIDLFTSSVRDDFSEGVAKICDAYIEQSAQSSTSTTSQGARCKPSSPEPKSATLTGRPSGQRVMWQGDRAGGRDAVVRQHRSRNGSPLPLIAARLHGAARPRAAQESRTFRTDRLADREPLT